MSGEYVVEIRETRTRADLVRAASKKQAAEIGKAMGETQSPGTEVEVVKVTYVKSSR